MPAAGALAAAAVGLLVTLPSLFLAFLAALTFLPKRSAQRTASGADLPVFAVLVPAHNEDAAIGRTVASLVRLRYPAGRFTVHVVADNCTDATAATARREGATVHERNDPHHRGKGAALNWLIDELQEETPSIDAFVVVDADSELSPEFLVTMSRHLANGEEIVQALNLVHVFEDRPLVRIRELAFELGCHLKPLAYQRLGGSSGLFGNGMCFSAAICRRYRWDESSVVEDAELFFRLVGDGHRITLATDAVVRSVMVSTLRDAGSQAVRWERGKFDFAPEVAGLLRRGLLHRDANALLAGVSGLTPPFAPLAMASVLALVGGAAAGIIGVTMPAAVAVLCLSLYALRGAALGGMSPAVVLRILLWAPWYCVWKVGVVTLAALGGGRREWKGARAGRSVVERSLTVD